jgi:CBS domain-containing protein
VDLEAPLVFAHRLRNCTEHFSEVVRERASEANRTTMTEIHPLVVLVFDEKYNLVGMANLREIMRGLEPLWSGTGGDPAPGAAAGGKPASETPVATVMRSSELFVEPGASVADAARLIVEHGLELVPVLEDRKKLIGVVRWQEVFQECSRAAFGG